MGMFKMMKDAATMVNAAPGLVDQANQMAAQAQQLAVAQQAAAEQAVQHRFSATAAPTATGDDLGPVEGITLQVYAAIAKQAANQGTGVAGAIAAAAQQGISQDQWERIANVWADRMRANPAVGQAFHRAYTEA